MQLMPICPYEHIYFVGGGRPGDFYTPAEYFTSPTILYANYMPVCPYAHMPICPYAMCPYASHMPIRAY